MDSVIERRAAIERELRAAIASDAITPYYQPLVSLETTRIIGLEALARWHSETLGFVAP
jgi:sensor c-di-GMP phosphodiesterase-like protein